MLYYACLRAHLYGSANIGMRGVGRAVLQNTVGNLSI